MFGKQLPNLVNVPTHHFFWHNAAFHIIANQKQNMTP